MAGSRLRNLSYFVRRRIAPGLAVGRGELVVDIGSGDRPFWRGDVFFDDLGQRDEQRSSGGPTVHSLGPFVSGDIRRMPFRDGAFDFSFCSHVLEHVDEPAAAIAEIVRVSRRGYIEVPNGVAESMAPFHMHLWFIYVTDEQLVFVRKSKRMHDILTANGRQIGNDSGRMREPFVRWRWSGDIAFSVVDTLSDLERFVVPEGATPDPEASSAMYVRGVKLLRRVLYPARRRSRAA
jgi:SAM-dependent methyltransferase